jgi:hypothetical protein
MVAVANISGFRRPSALATSMRAAIGARVLVERGADVADTAAEDLAGIGRHGHLGVGTDAHLGQLRFRQSAWIHTRLRSATVNIGSLGLASSPSVAFFSMTVPAKAR